MGLYELILWVTLATGPSFATHDFGNQAACESFARWFMKTEKLHDAKAVCVPKKEIQS